MKSTKRKSQKRTRIAGSIFNALRWLAGPFIIIIYTVSMMVEKLRF